MKKLIPSQEMAVDDAGEEGSIIKAILDEEARWAREEEPAQTEETPERPYLARARAAYLVARSYETPVKTVRIDVRK